MDRGGDPITLLSFTCGSTWEDPQNMSHQIGSGSTGRQSLHQMVAEVPTLPLDSWGTQRLTNTPLHCYTPIPLPGWVSGALPNQILFFLHTWVLGILH